MVLEHIQPEIPTVQEKAVKGAFTSFNVQPLNIINDEDTVGEGKINPARRKPTDL
jgi:hypothetical protein